MVPMKEGVGILKRLQKFDAECSFTLATFVAKLSALLNRLVRVVSIQIPEHSLVGCLIEIYAK